MSTTALILVLTSAVAHASWNLAVKQRAPSVPLFLLAYVAGALVCLPGLVAFAGVLPQLPAQFWWLNLLTGLGQAIYCVGLAKAYQSGEYSRAYPIIRAIPVVLVALTSLVLGARFGGLALGGMVLIVAGCLLIPANRFSDLRPGHYRQRWLVWSLVGAAGTVIYSILDDRCLRLMRASTDLTETQSALAFLVLEITASILWLIPLVCLRHSDRRQLKELLKSNKRQCLWMGAAIYLTYLLVLIAMGFADNVSYIVAMRQISIPLGAVLGITVLNEPAPRTKLIGIAVTFIGLVIVSLN